MIQDIVDCIETFYIYLVRLEFRQKRVEKKGGNTLLEIMNTESDSSAKIIMTVCSEMAGICLGPAVPLTMMHAGNMRKALCLQMNLG